MNNMAEVEFKKSYPFIFSFFYLIQGIYNGIQYIVIPFWIISIMTVDLAVVLEIFAIATIPWFLKFIIGLLNDKYGTKKFGHRKPWIIIPGIFAGIWFIITGIGLQFQTTSTILGFFLICALMWNIGIAFADTSFDGLILEVTPKDKLGRVQGYTWAMNLFGNAAGGILLGALFISFNAIFLLFILEGVLFVIACIGPFFVEEKPLAEEIPVLSNLKEIFRKRDNWKVFISAILDSIPYGIVVIAYTLLILLYAPNPLISGPISSLSLKGPTLDAFLMFCLIGAVNGIGVVVGSILIGRFADKNRRLAVYISNFLYIPLLPLCFLFRGPYVFGIIMMLLLGIGEGGLHSSFQAVRGDISNKYPELRSTFFALIISFLNAGQTIGMAITGVLLALFSNVFSEYYMVLFCIMIIMAISQTLSLLIFNTINRNEYEIDTTKNSKK